MKKIIFLLLCAPMCEIMITNTATARICNSIYTVQCPIAEGATSCCRAPTESCAAANCSASDIIDFDDLLTKCPASCRYSDWTDIPNENKQTRCKDGTCEYQCKAGYYGLASNTCNKCPDGYTSTPSSGAKLTDCFLAVGSEHTDETGTYRVAEKCTYGAIVSTL